MTTNTITFWTPVIWPEQYRDQDHTVNDKSWVSQACNFTESFFHWRTRDVATVLELQPEYVRTNIDCESPIWWHTALKVACCFTLVIPAIVLLVKAVRRYLGSFHYIPYFRTIRKRDYIEIGQHSASGVLEKGERIYNDGSSIIVDRIVLSNYWQGSRRKVVPGMTGGLSERGTFHTVPGVEDGYYNSPLTMGWRMGSGMYPQYVNPKIIGYITLGENRLAITKVIPDELNRQIVTHMIVAMQIRVSSLDDLDSGLGVYSPGSLNEALWKIGCKPSVDFILVDKQNFNIEGRASLSILNKLAFEPSFNIREFHDFLFQVDPQGNFPIAHVSERNLDFLIKFFQGRRYFNKNFINLQHNGETLFAYAVRKKCVPFVRRCVLNNMPLCDAQIEKDKGQIFATAANADSVDCFNMLLEHVDFRNIGKGKNYNLSRLVLADGYGQLPILRLPSESLKMLCQLLKNKAVFFDEGLDFLSKGDLNEAQTSKKEELIKLLSSDTA